MKWPSYDGSRKTGLRARFMWIIYVAIAQHFVWAWCLWREPACGNVTSIACMSLWLGPALWFVLFIVAFLALISSFYHKTVASKLLVVPQQLLLLVSSAGAINAIFTEKFADGVHRNLYFILADQIPAVLIAVGHTFALLELFRSPKILYVRK